MDAWLLLRFAYLANYNTYVPPDVILFSLTETSVYKFGPFINFGGQRVLANTMPSLSHKTERRRYDKIICSPPPLVLFSPPPVSVPLLSPTRITNLPLRLDASGGI